MELEEQARKPWSYASIQTMPTNPVTDSAELHTSAAKNAWNVLLIQDLFHLLDVNGGDTASQEELVKAGQDHFWWNTFLLFIPDVLLNKIQLTVAFIWVFYSSFCWDGRGWGWRNNSRRIHQGKSQRQIGQKGLQLAVPAGWGVQLFAHLWSFASLLWLE